MNTANCILPAAPHSSTGSRFKRNRQRALELVAKKGFSQVSMRELASYFALTPGSLYNYYSSKDELLLEFIEEHYMLLLSLFDRRQKRNAAGQTLRAVLRGIIELHDRHPQYFQLATRDVSCLKPTHRACVDSLRQRLRQKLAALLRDSGHPGAAADNLPTLELFEYLPVWLAALALDSSQRCAIFERLLTAPYLTPISETRT